MIEEAYSARANGKLLLTGEYFVLDGAKAVALPTQLGQSLKVSTAEGPKGTVEWISKDDEGKTWFTGQFNVSQGARGFQVVSATDDQIAARIVQILNTASELNPELLDTRALTILNRLEFSRDWGLGSSSTLIRNLADWLHIDAYQLLERTFGGSGYDIACASASGPLIYRLDHGRPTSQPVKLDWPFKDHLYFIYLGKKQDSRDAIKHYRGLDIDDKGRTLQRVNELSDAIMSVNDLRSFISIIEAHETLLSKALHMERVKDRHFRDFAGGIKSLGAWGGDFILAACADPWHKVVEYFTDRGFPTAIAWRNIILE